MSLGAWIFVGLITGLVTGRLLNAKPLGYARDVVLGVVGATMFGELFNKVWPLEIEFVSIPSVILAAIGAVVLLGAFHLTRRPAA